MCFRKNIFGRKNFSIEFFFDEFFSEHHVRQPTLIRDASRAPRSDVAALRRKGNFQIFRVLGEFIQDFRRVYDKFWPFFEHLWWLPANWSHRSESRAPEIFCLLSLLWVIINRKNWLGDVAKVYHLEIIFYKISFHIFPKSASTYLESVSYCRTFAWK